MEERDCDARKVECKPPTPLRRAVYELVHAQREPYMSTMSELNISKSDRWGWKNMFSFLFARIVSLSASHPSISESVALLGLADGVDKGAGSRAAKE